MATCIIDNVQEAIYDGKMLYLKAIQHRFSGNYTQYGKLRGDQTCQAEARSTDNPYSMRKKAHHKIASSILVCPFGEVSSSLLCSITTA